MDEIFLSVINDSSKSQLPAPFRKAIIQHTKMQVNPICQIGEQIMAYRNRVQIEYLDLVADIEFV